MNSSILCYPKEDAQMIVERCGDTEEITFMIGTDLTFSVTQAQMLDLAMKIQSVVNAIDRENRIKDEAYPIQDRAES